LLLLLLPLTIVEEDLGPSIGSSNDGHLIFAIGFFQSPG
jgi:hypothetical protein